MTLSRTWDTNRSVSTEDNQRHSQRALHLDDSQLQLSIHRPQSHKCQGGWHKVIVCLVAQIFHKMWEFVFVFFHIGSHSTSLFHSLLPFQPLSPLFQPLFIFYLPLSSYLINWTEDIRKTKFDLLVFVVDHPLIVRLAVRVS